MLRRILTLAMLFSLLGVAGTFSAGCEQRDVDVKEKKVEIKEDAGGGREVEVKEKKIITEPDGTTKEVTTEEETKVKPQ